MSRELRALNREVAKPMTEPLTMMATPAWAYLALFGLLVIDALVPVVPTQAIMITAGGLTVYGGLSLPLVIAVGALGMFTGDVLCFVLGRTAGHHSTPGIGGRLAALRRRCAPKDEYGASAGPSTARRAAVRFTRGLRETGPLVLMLCRFVPGGRMVAGYHAGRTNYPLRLFVAYDGAAALAWATYGGLVGHIGGTALTQSAWRLFAVAAAAAAVFGTAGWVLALFGGHHDSDSDSDGDSDGHGHDNQSQDTQSHHKPSHHQPSHHTHGHDGAGPAVDPVPAPHPPADRQPGTRAPADQRPAPDAGRGTAVGATADRVASTGEQLRR